MALENPALDEIQTAEAGGVPSTNARSAIIAHLRKINLGQYALAVSAITLVIVILGLALLIFKAPAVSSGLDDKTRVISRCIDKFSPDFKRVDAPGSEIGAAFGICYSIVSSSLLAEEQENRNGSLVLQKSENIVLMWMVVVITVSGVILAGLQLLASYELAKIGKGTLVEGGSVDLKPGNVVVQSSVIGVVILAISFAFFMVFVVDVYRVEEIGAPSRPSNVGVSAAPVNAGQAQGGPQSKDASPPDRR